MIDKILAFGSMFDWITPSYALAKDLMIGGTSCTLPKEYTGAAQAACKRLAIDSWGWSIVGEKIVFSVHKDDVRRLAKELGL